MADALANTARWFRQCFPTPTPKGLRTQVGVHAEEIAETFDQIGSSDNETVELIVAARDAMHRLGEHLKSTDGELLILDRVLLLDGLCDNTVTAAGVAHQAGMAIVGAMDQVNASNYSKFDDLGQPIYKDNGKVAKGPNYFEPDLSKFV